MTHFFQPDLGQDIDNPFVRDGADKLVRRSYWLDMNDRTLVMVLVNGIGANLTNDEKRAHLADLRCPHGALAAPLAARGARPCDLCQLLRAPLAARHPAAAVRGDRRNVLAIALLSLARVRRRTRQQDGVADRAVLVTSGSFVGVRRQFGARCLWGLVGGRWCWPEWCFRF